MDAIENPEIILEGERDESIAIKRFKDKTLVALYKEITKEDGFVITAFITSEIEKIKKKRRILWKKD